MSFDENSFLATTNPLLLLGSYLFVLAIAYYCVWKYRDTNDFEKSVKLYAILNIFVAIVYILIHIPFILYVVYVLNGVFVMMVVSNHFFYKR